MKTLLSLCLLFCASCASFGNYVSETALAKVKAGMTPEQVKKLIGTPTSDYTAGGYRTWTYVYSSATVIPLPFAAVGSSSSKMVTVRFKNGVVTKEDPMEAAMKNATEMQNKMIEAMKESKQPASKPAKK